MKNSIAKILELSDSFIAKYATKGDARCNCENIKCEEMGAHVAGHCKQKSTGKKVMYLGPICDECAMFMDPQYLID